MLRPFSIEPADLAAVEPDGARIFGECRADDQRPTDRERGRQKLDQFARSAPDQKTLRHKPVPFGERLPEHDAVGVGIVDRRCESRPDGTHRAGRWSKRVDARAEIREPAHRSTALPRRRMDVTPVIIDTRHRANQQTASRTPNPETTHMSVSAR